MVIASPLVAAAATADGLVSDTVTPQPATAAAVQTLCRISIKEMTPAVSAQLASAVRGPCCMDVHHNPPGPFQKCI